MPQIPSVSRRCALAATAALVALNLGGPVLAAEPSWGPGTSSAAYADPGGTRRLDLSIGRSIVIDLPRDAKEVFVANPAVANAVVRSARKIFLIGVANGGTSVMAMDAEGRQIAAFEVNVGRDLNPLRQTLRRVLPNARIDVQPAGDSILLTGTVPNAGEAQQALDIASVFVGVGAVTGAAANAGASSVSKGGVINALSITGREQVMLKVTVVEMARTAIKQLGINVNGNWNLTSLAAGAFTGGLSAPASAVTGVIGGLGGSGGSVGGQASFGNGNSSIYGQVSALERAGVSRILAEPTLVAISGETANFLAGGEIPIPIYSCTGGTTVGCTPSILYKKYGVSLDFTPVVLSEGRISLKVTTEVSEIDRDNQNTATGTPGFRTRRSSTSVELPSGGTIVTAGLISSQTSQSINGVPGLINLPILGALFRSRDFNRRDSELMIMVQPFIAKPMEAAQAVRPDDGFVDATDGQTILLGRLNKLYGVHGAGSAPGAGARFGFITD